MRSMAVGLCVAVASLVGCVPVAGAETNHGGAAGSHGEITDLRRSLPSSPWGAGYIGNVGPSVAFSLRWTVPKITCDASVTGPIVFYAIVSGYTGASFAVSGASLAVSCTGSTPAYKASVFAHAGSPGTLTVSAGDVLTVRATVSPAVESLQLRDNTAGRKTAAASSGMTAGRLNLTTYPGHGSAFSGFPAFSPITFKQIRVNGAPFSALVPSGVNQRDAANKIMVRTSALSPTGYAFTLTFVRNS